MLKMTKYTSLPNLVRLAQWEQISEYTRLHTYYILPVNLKMVKPSLPMQKYVAKNRRKGRGGKDFHVYFRSFFIRNKQLELFFVKSES